MAESTFAITKTIIDQEIGYLLGYGRTSGSWTSEQTANINQARQIGLTRFYSEKDWAFLHPLTTIATVADTESYTLPDSFGSLCGDALYFDEDDGYSPIYLTSAGDIRKRKSESDSAGIPTLCAIVPSAFTGATGQRYTLWLYPTPSDAWTLNYQYNILLDDLVATSAEYPAGGALHRNTILFACLAQAEMFRYAGQQQGWEMRYQQALSQSMNNDARMRPINLGYNRDKEPPRRSNFFYCTYNGSLPS